MTTLSAPLILEWTDADVEDVAWLRLSLGDGSIETIRRASGISLRTLATSFHCSVNTIRSWLAGSGTPAPDTALALARFFRALADVVEDAS